MSYSAKACVCYGFRVSKEVENNIIDETEDDENLMLCYHGDISGGDFIIAIKESVQEVSSDENIKQFWYPQVSSEKWEKWDNLLVTHAQKCNVDKECVKLGWWLLSNYT